MDEGRFKEAKVVIEKTHGTPSPFTDLFFGQRLLSISK